MTKKNNLLDEFDIMKKTGITSRSLIKLRNKGKVYFFKNQDNKYIYHLKDVQEEVENNKDLCKKHWKKNTYKTIDLFAGIGGFRIGFQQAFGKRCKFVFSNEIDVHCCKTYNRNFGEDPCGDITKIEPSSIPDFDILMAGFPCQPFSIAGWKEGFQDRKGRGNLFYYIADILKEKKPSAFLLENVKNLETHNKGKTFQVIKSILEDELGYSIHHKILNAKFFGIPQNRERIFIVGFKEDIDFEFPDNAKINTKTKVADILENVEEPRYFISQRYWDTLKRHRERHEMKGNGFGYEVLDCNGVANALVVGGMGLERNLIKEESNFPLQKNKDGIRKLTPRECARLQGFPDEFKIPVSMTQAYKQFANSVPIPVINIIAKKMLMVLDKN